MPTTAQVERYTQVAADVLAMCRKVQPDFWNPDNHEKMATAWGYVLATRPYAPAVYHEAVGVYYAENPGDRRPGPGDIIAAAKVVRDRWEADPARREALAAHREQLREERDRQLAEGTFGQFRGYRSLAQRRAETTPEPVETTPAAVEARKRLRKMIGKIG
ncbi:hypothetical protein V5S96_11105 [Corynebacterium mastitidis]|uniref:Replicative helicase inhibitor G39P N-terminal domain-containing protein n=1 Tax=Corynebacterium mastitidis TaxID=161890 RepID=A0ABU8P0V1_9CORY